MNTVSDDLNAVVLAAVEQSYVAAVVIDEDGRIVFFNQAAARLWGYPQESVLGQHVSMLLPKMFRRRYTAQTSRFRERAIDDVVGKREQIKLERRDGSWLWAMFSLSKVSMGGHTHYMALARDVSDDVARHEQNQLLQLAIDHTDRSVLILDSQRRIVHANQAFLDLTGFERDEAFGQDPVSLLRCQSFFDGLAQPVRWGQDSIEIDVPISRKDGAQRWLRVSSVPFVSPHNDWLKGYSVDICYDITEDRQIRTFERDVLMALNSRLPFRQLGDYICERVREIAPDVLPSILRVDENGCLRPWAVSYLPEAYNSLVNGLRVGEGVGSCGTAAVRGTKVIVENIQTDPLWAPYAVFAKEYDLAVCWSYPIKRRDGNVAGTFAFYAREPARPTNLHLRIVETCAHLCALAIESEDNRMRMERAVQFDALTGLPNRARLHAYIDGLLRKTEVSSITLFTLGLDRFKDINQGLGHAVGDQVLLEMASRLQHCLNGGEFISRTEGDIFVIVATGGDANTATRLAKTLQATVAEPINAGGHWLTLSAGVGMSHVSRQEADRDFLLESSKKALYQAKTSGCGQCGFFSEAMNQQVQDRLLLGAALKRAVANNGLKLHYQPQVCPQNGKLHGVEALARWEDPTFGRVSPERFITLAEELGEIETIGRWVVREACRQMAEWHAQGLHVPVTSVNLSPLSFRDAELPEFVRSTLQEFGLSGNRLTIEITESAAMALTPAMLTVVNALRELEVGLSIDDFGTGFSSLSNLANLPVTEVKIDRSFIDKCMEVSRLQSLVQAVIGIGRNLELTVVAEGVETEAQYVLLSELACPVVQGYLFSRPLPPADFAAWVARSQYATPGSVLIQ